MESNMGDKKQCLILAFVKLQVPHIVSVYQRGQTIINSGAKASL